MEEIGNMGMAEEGMYNITMNGSLIRDWKGNILNTSTVDPEVVRDLWNAFPEVNVRCSGMDHSFCRGSLEAELAHRRKAPHHSPKREAEMKKKRALYEVFEARLEDVLKEPIMKMNYFIEDEELAGRMNAFLKEYSDRVVNAPFEENAYEITEVNTHKGSGVKWIAEQLGIGMDEIAVYGDSWNDLEMLKMFPHSYTTYEGIPKAKEIAEATLGSYGDHAVPYHILRTLERERTL